MLERIRRGTKWARRPPGRGDGARGQGRNTVLILTPVKDAAECVEGYRERLQQLTYPHELISVAFLESDSADGSYQALTRALPPLRAGFRRATLWQRDFGYRIPPHVPRYAPQIQAERRAVLARSRNYLLSRALQDERWVLWLDVDVIAFPPDLIERLLAAGRDIVQPHCVLEYGGRTFDQNAWRDHGRLHMDALRGEGDLVPIDAVGGTVLLIRADIHREGLVFPTFPYGKLNPLIRDQGEVETEGLGIMARDMGYQCWGMPRLEVIHRNT